MPLFDRDDSLTIAGLSVDRSRTTWLVRLEERDWLQAVGTGKLVIVHRAKLISPGDQIVPVLSKKSYYRNRIPGFGRVIEANRSIFKVEAGLIEAKDEWPCLGTLPFLDNHRFWAIKLLPVETLTWLAATITIAAEGMPLSRRARRHA